jgi:hypothetical protein
MARAVTITAEQVNTAADALKAEGVKITSRAIRQRLGNAACLGTVNKLLQRRKASQELQVEAAKDLPPVLQQAIMDYVGFELSEARNSADAVLSEQQQETADLATENEAQLDTIEAQAAELETLRAALEQERRVGEEARTELARAELRLEGLPRLEEAAEQARMDLAKAQFKLEGIPRLEEAAQSARGEMVKMQVRLEAMARLETEVATLKSQIEIDHIEMTDLRLELDEERALRIKAQKFEVDPIFKKAS